MADVESVLRVNLTESQYSAALDNSREVLCLACAGSGKSRTLAFRIARLVSEGVDPSSIVAFTFTEKAAESIKRRIASALDAMGLPATVLGAIYIGTIHSFCQEILGKIDAKYRQFDVLDDNRLHLYLVSRFSSLGLNELQRAKSSRYFETIKKLSSAWKVANDENIDLNEINCSDPVIGASLLELKQRLIDEQYIDFSLMIRLVVDAFQEGRPNVISVAQNINHLLVDEYQDVNPSQEALISAIHSYGANLFVVGDDDQAIYAWRGADISNILEFTERYRDATKHTLSVNYRSSSAIVESADCFASEVLGGTRYEKNPRAANNISPRDYRKLWFEDRESEAAWVARQISHLLGTKFIESGSGVERGLTPGDFAILMRSTVGSGDEPRHTQFTKSLESCGIRVNIENGGRPFDRSQVQVLKDIFELLRDGNPARSLVKELFDNRISDAYPNAGLVALTRTLARWGERVHSAIGGTRQRIYPQVMLQEVLAALGVAETGFSDEVMQDIGVFSRIMQDVETVYLSVDSASRYREVLNFLSNIAEQGYDSNNDLVVQRPDAVSILTVHKAKGLEFPVVFVVDVEQGRFPGRRSRYRGWIPEECLVDALERGAYQSDKPEDARAFYTAITRAERFLYVTGCQSLPGGKKRWKESEFSLRLSHDELRNTDDLPLDLVQVPQLRRVDENVVPTSFSEIKYYLKCPYDYKLRKGYGFSPAITEMFGFGQTVHAAISKLHEAFNGTPPNRVQAEALASEIFHLKHIPPSSNPNDRPGGYEAARGAAQRIAGDYVVTFGDDFEKRKQVEVRFEIPANQTVITGAIDLLIEQDEEDNIVDASVIDFKSMEGGSNPIENRNLDWNDLSLQVQLYAKAANDVLGQNAKTGCVHLLKDQIRQDVPIDDLALHNAVANIEWAINGILNGEFPMRPQREKCEACDFKVLCRKQYQSFNSSDMPPPLMTPAGESLVRSFSQIHRPDK